MPLLFPSLSPPHPRGTEGSGRAVTKPCRGSAGSVPIAPHRPRSAAEERAQSTRSSPGRRAPLYDTTIRLLSQEPLAGRVPTGEVLRVAEILDGAGFACLEGSGGGGLGADGRG